MMTGGQIENRIAKPGDPDLDCQLTGLRFASVIATDTPGTPSKYTSSSTPPKRPAGGSTPPRGSAWSRTG
jgi:hypothetical protein